jgi:hypothetical protein
VFDEILSHPQVHSHLVVRYQFEFGKLLLKDAVFWDGTPCESCTNRSFEGMYRLYHQGEKNQRARNNVSSN